MLALGLTFALLAADGPTSKPLPRLTLAAGPLIGPHAHGEATCQSRGGSSVCEHTGNFFGVGVNLELRGQLFGPLYLQGRGLLVGNVRPRPSGVYTGLAGVGLGLGAYSRLAFIRAEYLFVPTLGPDTYRPPFYDKEAGRDVWGRSAGMLSAGVRKYFTPRLAGELWAGLVVGPYRRRTSLSEDASERGVNVSFLASVGISFDVLRGRTTPRPAQPAPPQPAAAPQAAPQPPPLPIEPTYAPKSLGPWQPASTP